VSNLSVAATPGAGERRRSCLCIALARDRQASGRPTQATPTRSHNPATLSGHCEHPVPRKSRFDGVESPRHLRPMSQSTPRKRDIHRAYEHETSCRGILCPGPATADS
jgi:hypothetical protein